MKTWTTTKREPNCDSGPSSSSSSVWPLLYIANFWPSTTISRIQKFLKFLDYLQYFRRPEYVGLCGIPALLRFLDLLRESEKFRTDIRRDECRDWCHQQQFQSWQFHHRQEHVTPNLEPSVLEEGDWRATPLTLTGELSSTRTSRRFGRQSEAWFFSAETLGDEKVRAALGVALAGVIRLLFTPGIRARGAQLRCGRARRWLPPRPIQAPALQAAACRLPPRPRRRGARRRRAGALHLASAAAAAAAACSRRPTGCSA